MWNCIHCGFSASVLILISLYLSSLCLSLSFVFLIWRQTYIYIWRRLTVPSLYSRTHMCWLVGLGLMCVYCALRFLINQIKPNQLDSIRLIKTLISRKAMASGAIWEWKGTWRASNTSLQCESTPPYGFRKFFPKRLGIFNQFFTHVLYYHFYTRLQIFIQTSPTLTKLCLTKRDHLVNFYISLEL